MIVQAIRSALFYLIYFVQTGILAAIVALLVRIHGGWNAPAWALARYWGASNLFLLRWLVGIRTRVEGAHNVPEGGCIVAAKHQSDWDIFALLPHTEPPAFIAKKELLDIPVFGGAARAMGTISIDRKRGSEAIPAMLEQARAAIAEGRRIVIYPEGTRRAPLADPDYRYGVARLYEALNVPVVPVALNSGLVWPRNGLVLWPGTATARILPPIAPGLCAQALLEALQETIEEQAERLIVMEADKGLARPIPPELRERLDAAVARVGSRDTH